MKAMPACRATILLLALLAAAGGCTMISPPAIDPVLSQPATDISRPEEDGYYRSAVTAIDVRNYARALDFLQAARQRRPDSVPVLNAFGVVYDKLGRFDLSARYYAQARALDPNSPVIQANMAYSAALQGIAGAPLRTAEAASSASEPEASPAPEIRIALADFAPITPAVAMPSLPAPAVARQPKIAVPSTATPRPVIQTVMPAPVRSARSAAAKTLPHPAPHTPVAAKPTHWTVERLLAAATRPLRRVAALLPRLVSALEGKPHPQSAAVKISLED
jgi:hypothetical protein